MIQDSLKVAVSEYVTQTSAAETTNTNWWMWVALAELGIISFLLLKSRFGNRDERKRQFKKESIDQEIDFNNVIESSFHSTSLYNILKVKCHPDRFPEDLEKNAVANALFQEITKNKRNLKRLVELKKEATEKLSINF